MSKMSQQFIDQPETNSYRIEWTEKLNEDEQKAQDEASRAQAFTPIEKEPF